MLAVMTVISMCTNAIVVWGNTNSKYGIKIADESVIGMVDNETDTGYIINDRNLQLDCNDCDWEKISKVEVINEKGHKDSISEKGILTVPKEDGIYTITVICKDTVSTSDEVIKGEQISFPLKDITNFSNVMYDKKGIKIYSIFLGSTLVTEGSWVSDFTGTLVINTNLPMSGVTESKVVLNGKEIETGLKDKKIYARKKDIILKRNNSLDIEITNFYGTKLNYSTNFKYDDTAVDITKVDVSGKTEYYDDLMLAEKGANVGIEVNSGDLNITSTEVLKDNELYSDSLNFQLKDEGYYTLRVTKESGKVTVSNLFDGKKVTFDTDKPTLVKSYYGADELDVDKWYKNNSSLVFIARDNIALSHNYKLTINDKDYNCEIRELESGAFKYIINTSTFEKNEEGIYNVKLVVEDLMSNKLVINSTLKLDTIKPSYEGVEVESESQIDNVYYFKDNITLKGSFSDKGSGVKAVSFKGINDDEFSEISLPYTTNEQGTFKIEDVAGNFNTYSMGELLTLLGVSPYVVDDDNPVIVRNALNITYSKDGIDYLSDIPTFTYKITDSNMKSVDFYVNDVLQNSTYSSNDLYQFETKGILEGNNTVKVVATDKANHTSEDVYTFILDLSAPDNINVEVKEPANEKSGNVYYRDNVDVKISAEDKIAGIKTYNLNKEESSNGKFTVSSDGEYTFNIYDNLNNNIGDTPISEYTGWQGNNIIIDKEDPIIDTRRPDGGVGDWFDKNVIYKANITDDKGIDSAYITINGVKVDSFSTDKTNIKNTSLKADTSKVKPDSDGSYTIRVYTQDNSKRSNVWTDKIYIDTSAPTDINVECISPSNEKGGNVYFKKPFYIRVSASDDLSGITKYYLNDNYSSDGRFLIDTDGKYTVSVEDRMGNKSTPVTLQELLGWQGNNIVIDDSKPVFETARPEGEDTDNKDWYKGNVIYNVKINDNVGINFAYMKVNGLKVDEFTTDDTNVKSASLSLDTKTVSPDKNGAYAIEVYTEDNCGNENSWSDTIYVDYNPPYNVKANITEPMNEKGGNVYFNGDVNLVLSAVDDFVGLKGFKLNGNASSTGIYTINSDGEYSVSAYDRLYNESGKQSLQSLACWKGNNIVIDRDNPVISSSRPDGESSAKKNWYGHNVIYDIKVTDNKGIDTVYVTINGVKVDSFETEKTDVKNISLKADTSKVHINDDGSFNIKVYAEDNGTLTDEWEDTIYVDTTNPVVSDFGIYGDVSRTGKTVNGSDTYGFYFDGSGSVQVKVKDEGISSGIYSIWTKLNGQNWVEHITNGDSTCYVSVPENYKGSIEAYVVDNVGHKSNTNKPDGLVSETSNTHRGNSKLVITLPKEVSFDENNVPLYNGSLNTDVYVACDWSGLKKLEWGIGDNTYGTITDFSNASTWDKNLPLSFNGKFNLDGNSNSMKFWVKITDRTGHTTDGDKLFSIDKVKPVISVSYNNSVSSGYYNKERVANITVTERNFDSSKFEISGVAGSLGSWSRNGDTWSNTMVFNKDTDYKFTLRCSDRAENASNEYSSESFTVDTVNPVLSVSWDNNSVLNKDYYKDGRTATLTVNEHNFDSSLISVSNASISGWSSNGDTHTAKIVFNTDGEYDFSVSGKDKAGNSFTSDYKSGNFVIDKTNPKIAIDGISNGVSYKKDVSFLVSLSDKYLNTNELSVKLYGKNHKEKYLTGVYSGGEYLYSYDGFSNDKDTDDVYTLEVVGSDLAGNIVKEERVFSVNRFGSDYNFVETGYLGNYLNTSKDVTITEMNVDRIDTSKVKIVVTLNGKEIEVDSKYVIISEKEKDGKYLYIYTISKELFKEDGKYTIQVYSASDDGTEYTSVAEQYNFVIDTQKPVILVSGVESNEIYQDYKRKVTIDVRDFSGVKGIVVTLNGKQVDVTVEEDMYVFTIPESTVRQNLTVNVVDLAGNSNEVTIDNFLISSNTWVFLINQLWFKVLVVLVALAIIGLIVLLIVRKRKDIKKEEQLVKENEKYYRSSGASSSGSSSGSDETELVSDAEGSKGTDIVDNDDNNSNTDILE
jgi:hypothetical protein